MSLLSNSRELVEEFHYRALQRGLSQRAAHLLQEIRVRLRECDYTYTRTLELAKSIVDQAQKRLPIKDTEGDYYVIVGDVHQAHSLEDARRVASVEFTELDQTRLMIERFYLSAHRVAVILHDFTQELGISKIEAPGVRDARNHLIEHPTGHKGVEVISFMVGGKSGARLRTLLPKDPKEDATQSEGPRKPKPPVTIDEGIYANAAEFAQRLEEALSNAVDRMK